MLHVSIPKESSSGNSKNKKNLLHVVQNNDKPVMFLWLYTVAQLVKALRYNPEGHGFDSWWCHWNFFIDIILDSVSNRNEYQEHFLEEKLAGA